MKAAVIAAAIVGIAAVAILLAAAKSVNTASKYMQLLYMDDREELKTETKAEVIARLKWWLKRTPYKICRRCCLFCEYTQACIMDVSAQEARQSMREYLQNLRQKKERGEQLDEHEQKAYSELEQLAADGKL